MFQAAARCGTTSPAGQPPLRAKWSSWTVPSSRSSSPRFKEARQIYSSSDSPVWSALLHVTFFPSNFTAKVKMVFELIMGFFQGFVVAILYFFLNGEVQAELRWKWRRWHLEDFLASDPKYQHPSGGSTGATCSTMQSPPPVSPLEQLAPPSGGVSLPQAAPFPPEPHWSMAEKSLSPYIVWTRAWWS
ncbi:uncharacterized protein LOC144245677 isoform X2 [Crocuta crocuta]